MSGDVLQEAFNATVTRDYEKAVSVIRGVLANSSNHSFSVEQLELIDHVYSCILNTSHYDETLIEVCWEWIDAIERTPRTVDTRAVSSSQLSIYYAYHTICRVQERMPRKATHAQLRQETWQRVTHSFSYLWAAATQLWKPYELDRLDILCSWSYLCHQFSDVVTEEVIAVLETAKSTSKEVLSNVVVIENSHQANQRLLTVERNLRDTRVLMEKHGRRINETLIKPSNFPSSESLNESISPPAAKKWCGKDVISGRERS
uniref:BACK domain-containing protein n=1 Tax=Caenorhabditis tropicalis TaxID=1561998 RepID=A0A1I7UT04_9PELO